MGKWCELNPRLRDNVGKIAVWLIDKCRSMRDGDPWAGVDILPGVRLEVRNGQDGVSIHVDDSTGGDTVRYRAYERGWGGAGWSVPWKTSTGRTIYVGSKLRPITAMPESVARRMCVDWPAIKESIDSQVSRIVAERKAVDEFEV